jgi:hypothetical protein
LGHQIYIFWAQAESEGGNKLGIKSHQDHIKLCFLNRIHFSYSSTSTLLHSIPNLIIQSQLQAPLSICTEARLTLSQGNQASRHSRFDSVRE